MPQVEPPRVEFQPLNRFFGTMKNEHSIDQAAADERHARVQWKSLLARLQRPARTDARLQRVRAAIESGEFHVNSGAIAERLIAQSLTS